MPRPKHSFRSKTFKVREQFVDREEAKNLYRNKLNHNEKDYNILTFYGVGGIGKSSLRKEICRLHKEENAEELIFYLDLNASEDRSLGTGILKLVDSCDNKKVDFKCFEMAYALYFRKKNPGAQYGRDKDLVVDNTFVGIGLNILGIFDNGITGTAAEIVERTLRYISNRTIRGDVQEILSHFDDFSLTEMEDLLPLFFQYDLQCYLERHPDTKVLIIFDTFEALNENVIEKVRRSRNERWIQNIISYFGVADFPNSKLLTIIFGRDRLEWDDDWQPLLDQYELKELQTDYSKEYLNEIGIVDPTIVQTIIRSSEGYPFLLYLSAETYANIINAGREPHSEDFRGKYSEIIERFLYNLDKDTVEVLRLVSVPNYYNVEIFQLLITKYNISFPMTQYEQFNKYSFVTKSDTGDEYYIHDLMRKGIMENSSEGLIQSIHKELLRYYSEKIGQGAIPKYIINLFYHAARGLNIQELNRWLDLPVNENAQITPLQGLQIQQARGEQNLLMQIMDSINAVQKDLRKWRIDLVNIYIDTVHLGGDYQTAVEICEQYLEQYTDEQIATSEQLIKMRIRKIHHSMFYMPVDNLIAEAKNIVEDPAILQYPEQYNELLFLLGGNLGLLYGDLEEASRWLDRSMKYAKQHGLSDYVLRTVRKQADICLARDDFDGALQIISPFVTVTDPQEDIDNRYKIYLMATLGEVYRKKGNLDTAWQCFDIVDKKTTQNHLAGWQAHAYLAKGMVEMDLKDFETASVFFGKAEQIYARIHQQWGLINVEEAKIVLREQQNIPVSFDEIIRCQKQAEKMHYQYNENFAKQLNAGSLPYLQLFFL